MPPFVVDKHVQRLFWTPAKLNAARFLKRYTVVHIFYNLFFVGAKIIILDKVLLVSIKFNLQEFFFTSRYAFFTNRMRHALAVKP